MKKILLVSIITIIIIPQITFASWWNPFSWSWFKKPTPVVQQEPTKQVTDSNLKQETNSTQIKSTKNGLPDTISAKDAKALGWGVNKPPVIQSDDTAKQLACSVQLKGLMTKWNNVESITYNKKLNDCMVGI